MGLSKAARPGAAVLVTDAHALGMIGVVRSLGRAGYRVHAVSSRHDALGFESTFCNTSATHPAYDDGAFLNWLKDYISIHGIEVIVPSEAFLHAISGVYEDYRRLIPDAVEPEVWRRCLSKVETNRALVAAGLGAIHIPISGTVRSAEDISSVDASELEDGIYYVKADQGQALDSTTGAVVVRCTSRYELVEKLRQLAGQYHEIIYQQYVGGLKVGVSLWRHAGEYCGEAMTLGIHMNPWHGGMMSLRRSFWHEALLRDAKHKMETLGWQGVAMMEYKWDPATDDFWFIEINARYWGYLNLDLRGGKDFPALQLNAFFGKVDATSGPHERDLVCRHTVPGDVGYLFSLLKSKEKRFHQKIGAMFGWVACCIDPRVKTDLFFPGDRLLYWKQWWRYLREYWPKSQRNKQ